MGLSLHTGKCLLRSIQVPPRLPNPLPALQLTQDSMSEHLSLCRLLVLLGKSPKLLVKRLLVTPQTRIHSLHINCRSASHINKNSCAATHGFKEKQFLDKIKISINLSQDFQYIFQELRSRWKPVWVLPLHTRFLCQLRAIKNFHNVEILS